MFILASKRDQFRQGSQVVLGATGSDLCPVAALLDYLSLRGDVAGPLFIQQNGLPLHWSLFVQKVQVALTATGLTGTNFNSHSFRIGAATAAGVAGVPEATINPRPLEKWCLSAVHSPVCRGPRTSLHATVQGVIYIERESYNICFLAPAVKVGPDHFRH